jgi:hypothetical protein
MPRKQGIRKEFWWQNQLGGQRGSWEENIRSENYCLLGCVVFIFSAARAPNLNIEIGLKGIVF